MMSIEIAKIVQAFFPLMVIASAVQGCSGSKALPATPRVAQTDTPTRMTATLAREIKPLVTETITRPAPTKTPRSILETYMVPAPTSSTPGVGRIIVNSSKEGINDFLVDENGLILHELGIINGEILISRLPCNLYRLNQWDIEKTDFNGTVLESWKIPSEDQFAGSYLFNYSISPDERYIAFNMAAPSGEMDPREGAMVDLMLLNLEVKGQTPVLITSKSGSAYSGASWSSDGKYLAFTDYDDSGVIQIYTREFPSGEVTQITTFKWPELGFRIRKIAYSPDSRQVAFAGYATTREGDNVSTRGEAGIINITDGSVHFLQIPQGGYSPSEEISWNDNSDEIFLTMTKESENNQVADSDYLMWFDGITGVMKQSFPALMDQGLSIGAAVPYQDLNRVILYGGLQNFIYDRIGNIIYPLEWPDLCCGRVIQFVVVPEPGIDSSTCK